MTNYLLPRVGNVPLKFEGEELIRFSSRTKIMPKTRTKPGGAVRQRWYFEIAIYRSTTGIFAAEAALFDCPRKIIEPNAERIARIPIGRDAVYAPAIPELAKAISRWTPEELYTGKILDQNKPADWITMRDNRNKKTRAELGIDFQNMAREAIAKLAQEIPDEAAEFI